MLNSATFLHNKILLKTPLFLYFYSQIIRAAEEWKWLSQKNKTKMHKHCQSWMLKGVRCNVLRWSRWCLKSNTGCLSVPGVCLSTNCVGYTIPGIVLDLLSLLLVEYFTIGTIWSYGGEHAYWVLQPKWWNIEKGV